DYRSLLIDRQLRVADDVCEQDMCDLQLDFLFNLGSHMDSHGIPDATILSSRLPRVERKARRPSTQRSKQPSKVHAGLRSVGDLSSDETGRSALVDERACQLAVFSLTLASMEAEIDDKMPSNSS